MELFPLQEEPVMDIDASLDTLSIKVAKNLIDDYPANDPRWANRRDLSEFLFYFFFMIIKCLFVLTHFWYNWLVYSNDDERRIIRTNPSPAGRKTKSAGTLHIFLERVWLMEQGKLYSDTFTDAVKIVLKVLSGQTGKSERISNIFLWDRKQKKSSIPSLLKG